MTKQEYIKLHGKSMLATALECTDWPKNTPIENKLNHKKNRRNDTMKTETNAQSTPTLIDTIETLADYDMMATLAIIEHPRHGRILITQGFCGIDEPRGGAIRWSGGDCVSLKSDDTFCRLDKQWNDATTIIDAVLHGHDDARPHLDWNGHCIEAVAESVGL